MLTRDTIITLFYRSTVIQGLVTLILVVVVSFMALRGMPIPEILTNALLVVLGYWFGSKTQVQQ